MPINIGERQYCAAIGEQRCFNKRFIGKSYWRVARRENSKKSELARQDSLTECFGGGLGMFGVNDIQTFTSIPLDLLGRRNARVHALRKCVARIIQR